MQGEGGAPGTPPNRTATTLLEDRRGRTMRLYRARRKHTGHRSARPERAAGGFIDVNEMAIRPGPVKGIRGPVDPKLQHAQLLFGRLALGNVMQGGERTVRVQQPSPWLEALKNLTIPRSETQFLEVTVFCMEKVPYDHVAQRPPPWLDRKPKKKCCLTTTLLVGSI